MADENKTNYSTEDSVNKGMEQEGKRKKGKGSSRRKISLALLAVFLVFCVLTFTGTFSDAPDDSGADIKRGEFKLDGKTAELVTDDDVRVFAKSMTFKTVSYDDKSKRDMTTFTAFHTFLEESFPGVHAGLKREIVNDYSLLFTWEGSDNSLKPILLAAHIDVVPAEGNQLEAWTYPPFDGTIDKGYVWGRGTVDCKLGVLGIMHAAEKLVQKGFQPKRTYYFAFGHDEEIGGNDGALEISKLLQKRGVKLAGVMDEGGVVMSPGMIGGIDAFIGIIGVAEKGYVNLKLSAEHDGPSAHSSTPPHETPLGIISKAIAKIQKNPFHARLTDPAVRFLVNLSKYSSGIQRFAVRNRWLLGGLVKSVLLKKPLTAAMVRTTLAPTMIQGSDKSNIIPLKVEAVINSRILQGDTVESVIKTVKEAIADPRVTITAEGFNRDPSPITKTPSVFYYLVTDTAKQLFPQADFTPYLVMGGTDARHYIPLSDQVLRFMPIIADSQTLKGLHGDDERVGVETYKKAVHYYYSFIRNADTFGNEL